MATALPTVRITHDLPALETEHLKLRKISIGDISAIHAYASDPEVTTRTTWDLHRSIDDTRQYMNTLLQRQELGLAAIWAVTEKNGDGQLIGECGFRSISPEHGRAELVFVLNRKYWGKGYMSQATHAVLKFAYGPMGMNRVEALVDGEDIATMRVLKRNEMRLEGTMRQAVRVRGGYRDAKLFAGIRSEFR